jgi:hypothetical protein
MREPTEPTPPTNVRERIAGAEAAGELTYEADARALLGKLESWGVVSDTCEWNLADWTWEFRWFCHAIMWGIHQ